MSPPPGTLKQQGGKIRQQLLGLKDSFRSRSRSPSQSGQQPDVGTSSANAGPNEGTSSNTRTSSAALQSGNDVTNAQTMTVSSIDFSGDAVRSRTPIIVEPTDARQSVTPGLGLEITSPKDLSVSGTPIDLTPTSGVTPLDSTGARSTTPAIPERVDTRADPRRILPSESKPGPPTTNARRTPTPASTTSNQNKKNRSKAWDGLRGSLQALKNTSRTFPMLSSAVESLISCLDGLEAAVRNREDFEELASELETLSSSLNQYMTGSLSTRLSDSVTSAAISIENQVKEIRDKLDRASMRGVWEANEDEEQLVRHYRRIEVHFRRLQANAGMSTWSIAEEHLANTRLENLNPSKQAAYDSSLSTEVNRRGCTEGTRIGVLAGLDSWLYDSTASPMYWMNGMAGTGKTTIASTFCERAEKRKLLGASFFCTRSSAECRAATRIVPTIAYQLARYSVPYQSALCKILGQNPDLGSKNVSKQFEHLLKVPLQQVKNAIPEHLVVVIDALDECNDRNGVELILDMLFRYAPQVPLKFLLTSRPEPEIYDRMIHSKSREVIHLHDVEKSLVQADIELYLNEELEFMHPSPAEIGLLVERSGALFIYAATLVRYIRSGKRLSDPHKRLKSVLSMTPEATKKNTHIDALYTAVLKSALNTDELEANEAEDIRVVLRTELSAQEPISIETIATFAGIDDPKRVSAALQPLRSVLHQSEETGLVSTLHASFPDFMFSNERSGSYFCDIVKHNTLLARRCFQVMKGQLRFNICDIETSFLPDEEVEGLQERVKKKISPTLAYACRYWASHLALTPKSDVLLEALDEFLCHRLLFWMEVLSLRRELAIGVDGMSTLQKWFIHARSVSPELMRLVDDASMFMTGFAVNPVSRSTAHIYISSLAFCPKSSSVYRNYRKKLQGLLELQGTLMERMAAAPLATWNTGSAVSSAAYSPDGTRIAVGCNDETVRLLNAFDGTPLVEPLRGHTSVVRSIAFSPEGKLVASGSLDNTIRVWNAYDGTPISGPFVGHTDGVSSVSFSPDGRRIVSGANDGTMRIWDAYDDSILPILSENLPDPVQSVALSPDGALIASGSNMTVQLWNTLNGTAAAAPFEGHTAGVTCLTFTPDGTRLISGSTDETIRIWDISNGSAVADPLKGHTKKVTSVAVSPDGMQIASGSEDRTVRVWRIKDGALVAGPFVDDAGQTRSMQVAYSPDGTRIISSSSNGTINVWNARDGTLLPTPFSYQAAIVGITSMVFCPDNMHFLASDRHGTVRIWDTSDGSFTSIPNRAKLFPTPLSMLSPDGSYAASTCENGEVQITETMSGSLVAGPFGVEHASLMAFWFSHNSRAIVMGCKDGMVKVCDLRSTSAASGSFKSDHRRLSALTESHDFSLLVSYAGWSNQEALRVWNIVTPALDLGQYVDPSLDSTLGTTYDYAALNDGWTITTDGWMVNSRQQLLFWIPASLAFAWCSPYATLVITESGTLQVPKQKPLIGDQWAQCYVPT